jgi:thiamine-phosphate pyrophosphorylase
MPDRQTLPAIWLMSDQSMGDALWRAIERVPSGGGVVLRHHRSIWPSPSALRRCAASAG